MPMTTNDGTDVKTYRRRNRWWAATAASVVVAIFTVAGSYRVMSALNVDGPAHASPIFPVTREVMRKGLGDVLDERLSEERLKAMLGVSASAAAAKEKEAQNALAKVAAQQGRAVETPPPGPDYAVKFFKTRSADLAEDLARSAQVATPKPLQPRFGAGNRDAELQAIRDAVSVMIDTRADLGKLVNAWASSVAGDAGVKRVWSDGKYTPPPVDFLASALDSKTLSRAVAKRVAEAVSVHTADAAAVASAARGVASRLTWGVTAIIFIGLWWAAMLTAGWQLWSLLPPGKAAKTLAVSVFAALAAGSTTYAFTRGPESLSLLGPLLQRLEYESGTQIVHLARLFGAMTTSAVVLLLAAASVTTWYATQATCAEHVEGVRTIFNVAAALLVAESIQIAALYTWPAATLEHAQSTAGPLGNAALLSAGLAGALFSVALMIVYLPAMSVLRAVARDAGDQAGKAMLEEEGVGDSGLQWLMRMLQALAPLLVAVPVSGLLTLFE
jgi:hypothetical protein